MPVNPIKTEAYEIGFGNYFSERLYAKLVLTHEFSPNLLIQQEAYL
jgi:hypothetical protein